MCLEHKYYLKNCGVFFIDVQNINKGEKQFKN